MAIRLFLVAAFALIAATVMFVFSAMLDPRPPQKSAAVASKVDSSPANPAAPRDEKAPRRPFADGGQTKPKTPADAPKQVASVAPAAATKPPAAPAEPASAPAPSAPPAEADNAELVKRLAASVSTAVAKLKRRDGRPSNYLRAKGPRVLAMCIDWAEFDAIQDFHPCIRQQRSAGVVAGQSRAGRAFEVPELQAGRGKVRVRSQSCRR